MARPDYPDGEACYKEKAKDGAGRVPTNPKAVNNNVSDVMLDVAREIPYNKIWQFPATLLDILDFIK